MSYASILPVREGASKLGPWPASDTAARSGILDCGGNDAALARREHTAG